MPVNKIWTIGGDVAVDGNGDPYLCDDCPCDDEGVCSPCWADEFQLWTGQQSLSLAYSGFGAGTCPGNLPDPPAWSTCDEIGGAGEVMCYALNGISPGGGTFIPVSTQCHNMNITWPLNLQTVDNPGYHCYWAVSHIGSSQFIYPTLGLVDWYTNSYLSFTLQGTSWKLRLQLYTFLGSYSWLSDEVMTITDFNCADVGSVTFNSSNQIPASGTSPSMGYDCPCDVGQTNSYDEGSNIIATVTGW